MKILKILRDWTLRATGIAFAVLLMSLAAPLLDTAIDQRQQSEILPMPQQPLARVAVTLHRGDTLLSVLTRFGLPSLSAQRVVEKVRPLLNLRTLRPGHNVRIVVNPTDQSVQGMEVALGTNLVSVKSTAEGWSAERRDISFVRETRIVGGAVAGSLYESGVNAGLTPQQILELAHIFE